MEPPAPFPVPIATHPLSAGRIWLARAFAGSVDLVQLAAFAVTAEGALSPVEDGLDLAAAAVLTALVGWNIAFLPSFVVKLVPVVDLAPTWTVAVLIATAGRRNRDDDLIRGRPAATPLAPVPMLPAGDPGGRRAGHAARVRAAVWFALVCGVGFVVGKLYLMPHLPPAGATWRQNWAGAVLGGVLGLLAARAILRRAGRLA